MAADVQRRALLRVRQERAARTLPSIAPAAAPILEGDSVRAFRSVTRLRHMPEGRPSIPAELRRVVLVEAGHRCG